MRNESGQLREKFMEYRESLEDMTTKINERHSNNTQTVQTKMKEFYTHLKEELYKKKNENYQLVRELQQLEREKFQLHQQILFCQRRIEDLEDFTGVEKQQIEGEDM